MTRSIPARGALVAALLAALAAPPSADKLVTEDGRILECKKAREVDGGYRLEFEHGVVECPAHLLAEVAVEGDMSDYVPKDDREAELLEKGYVRFNDRWMSKAAYEAELNRRNEERRERYEERAAHAHWSNAWETETKHFVIRTNTSPELLEYYADLIEAYYDLMDDRIGIKPTPTLRRTKMTINIYKSHEEFVELSEASSMSVLGYFWSYDQTLNFFHDYQEPARSDWVALHECTHLLTYLIDPQFRPQIWINEAVADYFGSADIRVDSRGRVEIVPGKLQTDRVLTVQQAIQEGKDTTLEELFELGRNEFDGFQYAHAWSFVYFLNESDSKYRRGFEKFFKDLYTRKGVEYEADWGGGKTGTAFVVPPQEIRRLLLKKLGLRDTESLEKEWKDFIAAIPIEAPEARFKRGWRTVMYGEGMFVEGEDQAARQKTYEETTKRAMEDLDFAIENGFDDPRAYWARGRLKTWRMPGTEGGVEDFRKAIELDPLNPAYRFDLAQGLSGQLFSLGVGGMRITIRYEGDGPELRGSREEIEEARRQFGLAMELSPENDLYAETYQDYLEMVAEWEAENADDEDAG